MGASKGEDEGLRSLLRGEPQAVARAAAVVRRVVAARGYAIPREERQDVAQEAMLQLWRALSGPAAGRIESLDALAATIAHRCCLAWMRRRRLLQEIPPEAPDRSPSAEEAVLRREKEDLGLRVVRELRPGCREILRLHVLRKLSYGEMARILNRSEHGLRTQMYECLHEARAILDRLRKAAVRAGPTDTPRGERHIS